MVHGETKNGVTGGSRESGEAHKSSWPASRDSTDINPVKFTPAAIFTEIRRGGGAAAHRMTDAVAAGS